MKRFILFIFLNSISFLHCADDFSSSSSTPLLTDNEAKTSYSGNCIIQYNESKGKIKVSLVNPKTRKEVKEIYKTSWCEKLIDHQNTPQAIILKLEVKQFLKSNYYKVITINKKDGDITSAKYNKPVDLTIDNNSVTAHIDHESTYGSYQE